MSEAWRAECREACLGCTDSPSNSDGIRDVQHNPAHIRSHRCTFGQTIETSTCHSSSPLRTVETLPSSTG